jgi:hypothetical protein
MEVKIMPRETIAEVDAAASAVKAFIQRSTRQHIEPPARSVLKRIEPGPVSFDDFAAI